jgi:hypothetical protein
VPTQSATEVAQGVFEVRFFFKEYEKENVMSTSQTKAKAQVTDTLFL